jgi:hypothetical protein
LSRFSKGPGSLLTLAAECRFRWIACQLDALHKSRSVNELHQTLQSLPKTLELTYERIFSQIDENDRHRARALLQWLAYRDSSNHTFIIISSWTLPQIAEAVAITADKDFELGDRFREPRELLDIASSLVSVDELDCSDILRIRGTPDAYDVETFRLAHASVLEYLESARLREPSLAMFYTSPQEAHVLLAKSCLRYLLFFDTISINEEGGGSWHIEYPMLYYAATSWDFHLSQIQPDTKSVDDVYALVLKVLDVNRQCFEIWQTVAGSSTDMKEITPPALALRNRLPGLFKVLIDNGHDPSEEETVLNHQTVRLLELAVLYNQTLSAIKLFGSKIYLEKVKYRLREFIDLALSSERSEIISLLINHARRPIVFTPVMIAMKVDRYVKVLRMIPPGFPINAYSKWAGAEGTLLSYAFLLGRLRLVISFLENGADAALEIQQAELPGGARFLVRCYHLRFFWVSQTSMMSCAPRGMSPSMQHSPSYTMRTPLSAIYCSIKQASQISPKCSFSLKRARTWRSSMRSQRRQGTNG